MCVYTHRHTYASNPGEFLCLLLVIWAADSVSLVKIYPYIAYLTVRKKEISNDTKPWYFKSKTYMWMFLTHMCMSVKVYCLLDIRHVHIGKHTCTSVRTHTHRHNIASAALVTCSSRCISLKCQATALMSAASSVLARRQGIPGLGSTLLLHVIQPQLIDGSCPSPSLAPGQHLYSFRPSSAWL